MSAATLGGVEGNDIWGWTASDGSEYALVGLTNGTAFVKIYDPSAPNASPINLGFLPSAAGTNTWRDIKVINDYAWIVCDYCGSHGIQGYDLNQLTSMSGPPVTLSASVNLTNFTRAHNLVANETSEYLYSVGTTSSFYSGGFGFFDVSTPAVPSAQGGFSGAGYSHDAICVDYRGFDSDHIGKEICFGFNASHVAIVDVSDKTDGAIINTFTYPGVDYTHQGWITDDHKYLFVDDELDETGNSPTKTFIFDISDLDNPVLKYTYLAPVGVNSTDHNLYVKGPYVYQANYSSGLRILDISNIDNNIPTEAGYFDIYPPDDHKSWNGAWSVYPYFKSGKVLISGIENTASSPNTAGLFVVDLNLPHYVLELADAGIKTICQGEQAVFNFNTTSYAGFSNPDNITVSNVPNGAIATLSANPIDTDGSFTLTVQTSAEITTGKYNIILTGTETPVNRISIGLIVEAGNGGLPTAILTSPNNNAISLPLNLTFIWNPVSGATKYDLDIATDMAFNSIVFNAYDLTSTFHSIFGLDYATTYYWRISSKDNSCATSTAYATRNFTTVDLPVPVELINFSGSVVREDISLNWQTASELGSLGFELQRAEEHNKLDFKKIAWIDSYPENTSDFQTYNFIDKNVLLGSIYYYRLKQVDQDGGEKFSEIISLQTEGKNPKLHAYPNPAKDHLTIFLDQVTSSENTLLAVYDVTGRQITNKTINFDDLSNGYKLNISHLIPGTYMLALKNNTFQESMRFVKW